MTSLRDSPRTGRHGVLAVGMTPDGRLQCPWHRADYDVNNGSMRAGPKGRTFGFKPYSAAVEAVGEVAKPRAFPVEVHDGAIWLQG